VAVAYTECFARGRRRGEGFVRRLNKIVEIRTQICFKIISTIFAKNKGGGGKQHGKVIRN